MRVADNEVATVAVVRNDNHDALDQAIFDSRLRAAGQPPMTAQPRAVALHGEGKSSCSGSDIASFLAVTGGHGACSAAMQEDAPKSSRWRMRRTPGVHISMSR